MTGTNQFLRVAEAFCGILAAAFGAAGLAFSLLSDTVVIVKSAVITVGVAPCASQPCPQPSVPARATETVTHSSIASTQGIGGVLEFFVIAVGVVLLVIAVAAVIHAVTNGLPWLVLLGAATALVMVATVLTGFSIGLFFIPADFGAVAAVAIGIARFASAPNRVVSA